MVNSHEMARVLLGDPKATAVQVWLGSEWHLFAVNDKGMMITAFTSDKPKADAPAYKQTAAGIWELQPCQ